MKPIVFRYSTLKTAEFCPEKYRLMEIEEVKEPGIPNIALAFGSALHAGIEAHLEGLDDAIPIFKAFWSKLDPKAYDIKYSRFDFNELEEVGQELLRKWVDRHAKHYKPLFLEKTLEFTIGNFSLKGTVDFIGYYKDKLTIVDWKTSAYEFPKKKILCDMQLWLYVHAVKQKLDLNIEQVLYAPFIKNTQSIQTPIIEPVTENKLKLMLELADVKMEQVMRYIETKKWPKNTDNCLRCPFFDTCYEVKK